MESPYNGRAIINDSFAHVEITIPTRKIYFIIVIFSIWIIPAGLGGLAGIIKGIESPEVPFIAMLFMFIVWSAAITFVGRMLWWMIAGKEIIEVDTKVLQITRKALLFSKPKIYDITECRSFRVMDTSTMNTFPFGLRSVIFNTESTGAIVFDYGMRTIKFGAAVDEAEAKHIINVLKEKSILTDVNLS